MKYLDNDVDSLYEILEKFNKNFFDLEHIDPTKSISISSLALTNFLTNYYDHTKKPIYIPKLKQYNDIKQGW